MPARVWSWMASMSISGILLLLLVHHIRIFLLSSFLHLLILNHPFLMNYFPILLTSNIMPFDVVCPTVNLSLLLFVFAIVLHFRISLWDWWSNWVKLHIYFGIIFYAQKTIIICFILAPVLFSGATTQLVLIYLTKIITG